MKTYRQIACTEVDEVTCDRCGRTDEARSLEGQEFLEHYTSCGYASVFGDMNHVRLDLCQHCVKEVLGPWIEVLDQEGSPLSESGE